MRIEFNYDQIEEIVREALKESLRLLENHSEGSYVLCDSLHRVIAYYSVPGEYLDGVYDDTSENDMDYAMTYDDFADGDTELTITLLD
jgi:hypothetical protein